MFLASNTKLRQAKKDLEKFYASRIMMTKSLKKKEEDEESDGDETIIDQTVSKKKGVKSFSRAIKMSSKKGFKGRNLTIRTTFSCSSVLSEPRLFSNYQRVSFKVIVNT
ncbi:hypothetical protein BpHYR1_003243, partial [Brachionus plicatilis]